MGFDSKLDKCHCVYYERGEKIKTHPVSVVSALNEIKRKYRTNDVKKLLEYEKIEDLADKWIKKTTEVHKRRFPGKGFNERGFHSKHLISFLEFFKDGKIRKLRNMISENRFDEAYELLTHRESGIKGVGSKVAKLIIRDLAFSITEWGKNEELDPSLVKDAKVLSYAIPVDRWARRVFMSIPLIGNKVKDNLEISDLTEDNINNIVDEKLGLIIAELCYGMKLNPMGFDLGAYLFGKNEIKSKKPVDEIYTELEKSFT